ncbi:tetratricopeptide repeat protein [Nonomuraea sp. NPDC050556]|uniref:tetratricopeptide repeat protein n=1 Tax=Nonomuraea sp. NPDC050556 TaxID=3364369 RepID=UPI0037A2BF7B
MNWIRALVAWTTLLALILGFPVSMLTLVGSPLPDHVPTFQELADRLTAPDNGTLIVNVLEFLLWGAWALFIVVVAGEIRARFRNRGAAPGLPGLGGLQRLVAHLVTSASLVVGVPATVSADTAAPPVVAMAPQHPLGDADDHQTYRVRQGDTLWAIADAKFGNPRRWPRIWKLNAHSKQPGGQRFHDPDLIRPGWKLRLPIKKPHKPAQEPSRPSVPSPSPRSHVERDQRTVVELPSGSLVALAYVAGISTAFAANRLLRRRRRTLPGPVEPIAVVPEPQPEPLVREFRHAFRESFKEPPPEEELLREAYSIDVPAHTAIGQRLDGSLIEVDLAGPGLGLQGEGVPSVVRYLILDILRQSSDFRTELIICADTARTVLLEQPPELPGLVVTTTPEAALKRFNETHFSRRRMLLEREAADIEELRERDPGEPLPAVLLVTELDDEVYEWITAPLMSGKHTGVGALVLGDWPGGTSCRIDESHRVEHAEGRLAEKLEGAHLFHITQEEAAASLRVLVPPVDPTPSLPAVSTEWTGPELVRLSILGPPTVLICNQSAPLELSWLQLSLLVYLALHREGATRDQLTTALWPDETGKDVHNTLRHLRSALATATGYVSPDVRRAPFINASTTKDSATYRIDPQLIGVDLWDFNDALGQAGADPTALARAAALCKGELARGLETDWIEDHRYPLTRSQADLLSQYASRLAEDDPEQALDTLERARQLDPEAEELYVNIVELQLRLGQRDAARRSVDLLRKHQRGLGLAISPLTERRLRDVFAQSH